MDLTVAEENSPIPNRQQQHHHHTNNVVNGEDKEDGLCGTRYEVFIKILDELLKLHKSFTEIPPSLISKVKHKVC